jgi:DNA-binding response OmpR family regulator
MHEIQEVLHAVLAPRGLRVDWVRSHAEQFAGESADCPDILVIDAEALPISSSSTGRNWEHVPQVILGDGDAEATAAVPGQTYLSKPFQFPELIQVIENLLPTK